MHIAASTLAVFSRWLSLTGEELRAGDTPAAMSPKIPSIWEQDYATGDWNGWRDSLEARGVVISQLVYFKKRHWP